MKRSTTAELEEMKSEADWTFMKAYYWVYAVTMMLEKIKKLR